MIKANGLVKTFTRKGKEGKEKIRAVDELDLDIEKGENYGLIGPNGAGKTTTLKMLASLIIPDEGSIFIDGQNIAESNVQDKIGVVVGEFTRRLYFRLTGRQNLRFFANLKERWDAEERIDMLLEKFGLKDWEDELYMKYSKGMKHKLSLSVALVNDPPILFLDEPLTGIDPKTKHKIKKYIKTELNDKTIIWASHNLFEVEEMCNRIGLLKNGKKVLEGRPEQLKNNHWDFEEICIETANPTKIAQFVDCSVDGDKVIIKSKNVNDTITDVVDYCKDKGIEIQDIKTKKPSLEEIVIEAI